MTNFARIEDLCQRAEIPVHKWHGDASQSGKKNLVKSPSGVLLITPESIESLFINRSSALNNLFSNLSYIVIDEMHSFIGNERGAHLKSLISRLSKKSKNSVRFIGLSATLGADIISPKKWLYSEKPESVKLIKGDSDEKSIKYLIKSYIISPEGSEKGTDETFGETVGAFTLANEIIHSFYGKTALIFANSKIDLELYTDLVSRLLEKENKPNSFRIHHGSLSKVEREFTEDELKSGRPTVTFCSSTLEMGIDVGNVSIVGQIGAPWSVSSLTQRLGRSGRKDGESAIMKMYITEKELSEKSDLVSRLYPELLQAIAMTELMLEKWSEPAETNRLHLSTLIQQILSLVSETGGRAATHLFSALIQHGTFNNVSQSIFIDVLRAMGENDLIEQTPEGLIILGLLGEKIVRSFDFYSAFTSPKELNVLHNGKRIGSISGLPTDSTESDKFLILAGKRWKVLEINEEREEVLVAPSKGGKVPIFLGSSATDIHPKIRQKMLEILCGDSLPVYLDSMGKDLLMSARNSANEAKILKNSFFIEGNGTTWFTWTGCRIHRTLWALGKLAGLHIEGTDEPSDKLTLCFKNTQEEIIQAYVQILEDCPSILEIGEVFLRKAKEKYDGFLSEDLQILLFSRNNLDLEGAIDKIRLFSV
jgi:ATP-dependent Lhr-like helicase